MPTISGELINHIRSLAIAASQEAERLELEGYRNHDYSMTRCVDIAVYKGRAGAFRDAVAILERRR